MDISRYAADRFRGWKHIFTGLSIKSGTGNWWQDNVKFDPQTKKIVISAARVPLGDGITKHNYQISLSLEDVSALVTILGHAGSASDAALLREHLGKQVPALVKLLACATGLVPTPMAEAKPTAVKPT